MVDYIKAQTRQPGLAAHVRAYLDTAQAPAYPIYSGGTTPTGTRYLHHALTWEVFNSGFIELAGSLHSCWNSLNDRGAVNWNDFKRRNVFDVLNWLAHDVGLNLDTATVHNLEYGVNLLMPPAPPTVHDLLGRLLYYGKGERFIEYPVERGRMRRLEGYQKEDKPFDVKAYDKGTQQGTPDQRLRFERRVKRMADLNKPNQPPLVETLADLSRADVLAGLGTLLLQTFDRCFWGEDFTRVNLTSTEQTTVDKAHDPAHVASLLPDQRRRLKARYEQLTRRLDYSLSADLRTRIRDQWAYLLEDDGTPLRCHVLRRGASAEMPCFTEGVETSPMPRFTGLDKGVKHGIDPNQPLPNETTPTNPKNAVDQSAEVSRRCPVTGLDISHQPNHTRFVSKSTVKTWYATNRPLFDELARTYLTAKQAGASLGKQAYHIAKNIRNKDSNPRNNPRNAALRVVARADARLNAHPTLSGLDLSGTLRLRPDQQQRINHKPRIDQTRQRHDNTDPQ